MSFSTMKAVLLDQVGTYDNPKVPNKYSLWYASRHGNVFRTGDGCDMGLSWSAWRAGEGENFGEFAYVPSHRDWYIARGQRVFVPEEGDAAFFDWNGNRIPNHIGWVLQVVSSRHIKTVEFNHENGVHVVDRTSPNLWLDFGRPLYNAPSEDELYETVSLGV